MGPGGRLNCIITQRLEHKEARMTGRVVRKLSEDLIAEFLVEWPCLEAVGIQPNVLHPRCTPTASAASISRRPHPCPRNSAETATVARYNQPHREWPVTPPTMLPPSSSNARAKGELVKSTPWAVLCAMSGAIIASRSADEMASFNTIRTTFLSCAANAEAE